MALVIRRGADIALNVGADAPPVVWRLLKRTPVDRFNPQPEEIFNLFGSVVLLSIDDGSGNTIDHSTEDDDGALIISIAEGRVYWRQSLAETRALPLGRIAQYTLERRIDGRQEPLCGGFVNVRGGPNRD